MKLILPDKIRALDDNAWLDLLMRSVSARLIDQVEFPAFPPPELQIEFVGSANEDALTRAFPFYVLVKQYAQELQKPLDRNSRFLDFGCGWGVS